MKKLKKLLILVIILGSLTACKTMTVMYQEPPKLELDENLTSEELNKELTSEYVKLRLMYDKLLIELKKANGYRVKVIIE
jgi:hypothetical protein